MDCRLWTVDNLVTGFNPCFIGSSFQTREAGGKSASADIYNQLLDFCNAEISKAILGQNLTTEVKGGSYAATKSHMAVRKDIVDSDKKLVEKALNQLIRWIAELNFVASELPVFSMWEEEDVDKDLADRDKLLVEAGVRFTKEYWQKAYGFEEEDIESVSAPQPQTEQQFAEYIPPRVFVDAQKQIDSLIETAVKESGLSLTPLHQIIDESSSYEELQRKIAEAYKDIDMSQFREILSRAMFMADLKGRSLGA